jgi:hypothetical protein
MVAKVIPPSVWAKGANSILKTLSSKRTRGRAPYRQPIIWWPGARTADRGLI